MPKHTHPIFVIPPFPPPPTHIYLTQKVYHSQLSTLDSFFDNRSSLFPSSRPSSPLPRSVSPLPTLVPRPKKKRNSQSRSVSLPSSPSPPSPSLAPSRPKTPINFAPLLLPSTPSRPSSRASNTSTTSSTTSTSFFQVVNRLSPRPDLFKIVSSGPSDYSLLGSTELSSSKRYFEKRSVSADQLSLRSLTSVRSSPGSLYRGNSSTLGSSPTTPVTPVTPSTNTSVLAVPLGASSASGILQEGAGGEFYAGTYFPTIHEQEEEERLAGSQRRRLKQPGIQYEGDGSLNWHYRSQSLGTNSPVGLRRSVSESYKHVDGNRHGMPSSVTSNTSYQGSSSITSRGGSDTKATPQKRLSRVASVGGGHVSTRSDAGTHMVRSGSVDPNVHTPARPTSSAGMSSTSSVYSRSDTPDYFGRQDSLSPTSASPTGSGTGDWDGTIRSRKEGQRVRFSPPPPFFFFLFFFSRLQILLPFSLFFWGWLFYFQVILFSCCFFFFFFLRGARLHHIPCPYNTSYMLCCMKRHCASICGGRIGSLVLEPLFSFTPDKFASAWSGPVARINPSNHIECLPYSTHHTHIAPRNLEMHLICTCHLFIFSFLHTRTVANLL